MAERNMRVLDCYFDRRNCEFLVENANLEESRVSSRKDYRGHVVFNYNKNPEVMESSLQQAEDLYRRLGFVFITISVKKKDNVKDFKEQLLKRFKEIV